MIGEVAHNPLTSAGTWLPIPMTSGFHAGDSHHIRTAQTNMNAPIEPSVTKTAFSCPHCGAYTTQHWFNLRAQEITGESPTPFIARHAHKVGIEQNLGIPPEAKQNLLGLYEKLVTGLVVIDTITASYSDLLVYNLHLSKCYNCKKIAVWAHEKLLFPSHKTGTQPNPDLPDEITKDFEEARSIVDESPRGAAALLRLCVQKLCKTLGEKGKNIDDDIASLVKKGLNPVVQQSLDIVRVIGNESVHPGIIDLNDDRETALRLFDLVNAITDQMISHPKKVQEMYLKLPESKRMGIEKRDGKTTKEAPGDAP
jgi:hypothetical protein